VSGDVDSVQARFPAEEWDERQFIVKPDCNLERDLQCHYGEEIMHRW
jgi:hypothetical protein